MRTVGKGPSQWFEQAFVTDILPLSRPLDFLGMAFAQLLQVIKVTICPTLTLLPS